MKTETRPLMNAAYHLLLVLALRAGIIFMVELMTYCGAYANDLTKPGLPMKSLVYCSEASPTGFDPNRYIAVSDNAVAATVFNRLLEYKLENTNKIEPCLAERWDISPDGRAYTFYLRRGVKFHATPWFKPTRDFNAEDVVFTFERMLNPNMPFSKAYPAEFPSYIRELEKIIAKTEALDPYTVRFTLHSVHAPFLSTLAIPSASILPAEYAQQLLERGKPSEINQKPVGTGPFIFRKYDKDSNLVFDSNPEYWKPEDVRLSKLIFSITPDAAVRAQKLIRNECQVSAVPRPADIAVLQKVPHLRVLKQSGFTMGYLAYNTTHPQLAVVPMPPLQWGYDKSLKDTPRDVKQARKLLAQAGYQNGFTVSLWAASVQRPALPASRLMVEMIQADWEKIGVKAKIATYEL